ncbi:cuticle collagen 40-like [Sorghum bicolor]|uniref:cuticle collagen 40-like n=1 Tax=Sorghum bicolor TaxID=4558 RepID=UPI000B426052|nr:cuticle collagen 40-like [Sorghum bicolor]|eukprot:XP_021317771.1 cuticle collagen 40-like [Sorghum bicolor]
MGASSVAVIGCKPSSWGNQHLSTASDVNPDHAAGQRVAEPACAAEDAAPQTTDQPAAAAAASGIEGESAPASAAASTPPRDGEAGRTAPPSSVAEGEDRAPTPPPAEERRVPTPPRAGASSSAGAPGLAQGPVIPSTTTGGGTANEEARASSDDEVEEIEVLKVNAKKHLDELVRDRDSWKLSE